MKFKAADFLVFTIFLIITCVFCFFIFRNINGNKKQLVLSNGKDEWIYPLSKDAKLEIPGRLGNSIIKIENGSAFFEDSPCDNKLCVFSHKVSRIGEWTACLPNGIIIKIEGSKKKSGRQSNSAVKETEIDAWTE